MKTNAEIRAEFREKYREAYKDILLEAILAKGNEWFEDFLLSTLDERMELVINTVKNFRTLEERFGVGIKENIARTEIVAELSRLNSITKGSKED